MSYAIYFLGGVMCGALGVLALGFALSSALYLPDDDEVSHA